LALLTPPAPIGLRGVSVVAARYCASPPARCCADALERSFACPSANLRAPSRRGLPPRSVRRRPAAVSPRGERIRSRRGCWHCCVDRAAPPSPPSRAPPAGNRTRCAPSWPPWGARSSGSGWSRRRRTASGCIGLLPARLPPMPRGCRVRSHAGALDKQLTAVRLRVLEACGRTQEYLNLARAARAHTSYAVMLVKLERMPEAIEYALKSFEARDEALALATALREAAAHDDALTIAEAGLGLAGDDDDEAGGAVIPLAHWLRDYAGGIGKSELALKAARTAFEHSLSLEDFGAVKPWAGGAWDAIRKDLLAHLAHAPHAYDTTRT